MFHLNIFLENFDIHLNSAFHILSSSVAFVSE